MPNPPPLRHRRKSDHADDRASPDETPKSNPTPGISHLSQGSTRLRYCSITACWGESGMTRGRSHATTRRLVSYTHLRAHETDSYLVCRLLLEKKKKHKP